LKAVGRAVITTTKGVGVMPEIGPVPESSDTGLVELAMATPTTNVGEHMSRVRSGLGVVAVVGILGIGTTVHAQQILAAGSIYGGPAQVRAVCYFYNAGMLLRRRPRPPTPDLSVTLFRTEITDQNGYALQLVIDECHPGSGPRSLGIVLAAGKACGIAADIDNNSTYSCRAFVSPSATNVRGILEVRDKDQSTLKNVELR